MSRRSLSPDQDPYNVQDDYIQQQQQHSSHQQQTQTQRHYLDDIDQIAYDSMSTILEVDSEGTNSETSDRKRHFDSPLHIETPRTPEPRTATLESSTTSNATNDRLSPVSDLSPKDKFSGIISALAEQMERLQPSKPSLVQKTESTSKNRPIYESKYRMLENDDDDATRPPSGGSSNSSSQGSKSFSKQGQQDASTSPLSSEDNSRLNSPAPLESPRQGPSPRLLSTQTPSTNVQPQQQQRAGSSSNLAPKSRTPSAESLMMITVSPMVSPKVKFPILKHAKQTGGQLYADENGDRKIIEVSNKSTITAIDLMLMDKMVQKYFVETRDRATQTIKFDCDDEFDTLEFNNRDGSMRRKTGAGNGSKAQVKSVAVGTEKFSRERFSLLPPTKTRSTQTKSNVDNDIGASETRRYKLAHLDLGTLRQQRSQPIEDSSIKVDSAVEDEPQNIGNQAKNLPEKDQPAKKTDFKAKATPSPVRRSKTPTEERPTMNEKSTLRSSPNSLVDSSKLQGEGKIYRKKEKLKDSLSPTENLNIGNFSLSISESSDQSNRQQTSANNSNESSSDSLQQVVPANNVEKHKLQRKSDFAPEKGDLETAKKNENSVKVLDSGAKLEQSQSRALIPSVKTELRVIIEIQDSKNRQRSEIMSDSQFIDGKLSKKTQVNTSKHVAATPREVLNKLQTVGRESSLLYQDPKQRLPAEKTTAAAVAATDQSALRWSSPPYSSTQNGSNHPSHLSNSTKRQGNENYDRRNWREVSKSSVVNEIETKTRQKSDENLHGIPGDQNLPDIIMTSDALINHMAIDKSAIKLRSRAAQRYESHERDPRTGELVRTGKITERTLVESEAGFNDDHAQNSSKVQDGRASKAHHNEKKPVAVEANSSGRKAPVTISNLLDNVADQQRRMKSEGEFASPSHRGTPVLSPRRQQSTMEEQQARQRSEQWTSQSTPNIRSIPQFERQIPLPKQAMPMRRQASVEIEEESEDRQQVMENGRLVYDDRLRERKYETQRTSSPSLNVQPNRDVNLSPPDMRAQENQRFARSSSMSPRSPILSPTGGILRNRGEGTIYQQQWSQVAPQQRGQLLKPLSSRPNTRNIVDSLQAPILFADQTSNLSASSDPETMDSGFAQSGAGSSSVINQRTAAPSAVSPQSHQVAMASYDRKSEVMNTSSNSPELSRQIIERQQRVNRDQMSGHAFRQEQLEEPLSLNFVDDDVDELIDQLDTSPINRRLEKTSDSHRQSQQQQQQQQQLRQASQIQQKRPKIENKAEQQVYHDLRASSTQLSPPNLRWHDKMISPPPAFRSSEPALNKLQIDTAPSLVKHEQNYSKQPIHLKQKEASPIGQDTQLITKLTRTKRQQPGKDRSNQYAQQQTQQHQKQQQHQRTQTKLEQSILAPESRVQDQGKGKVEIQSGKEHLKDHQVKGCRFKAQVMFESDTDSMSVSERQSGASQSSRCSSSNANILKNSSSKRARKELVTETKYSSTQLSNNIPESGFKQAIEQQGKNSSTPESGDGLNNSKRTQNSSQQVIGSKPDFLEPNWDYSLRVNRMRGNKVDSKVNTYIKHSRQPLVNLEAS